MKYGPLFGISDEHSTPENLMKGIREFAAAGAHGVFLRLDKLEKQYWTPECFREIFSASRRLEIYAGFYRDPKTADLTDEERAEYLVMAAEAGADIVDVLGDFFDRQPDELTMDPEAVSKQKALIERLKKTGTTVLMSSHVQKPRKTEDALTYFYAHHERGADISKAVFACDSEADLAESRRTSSCYGRSPCQENIRKAISCTRKILTIRF